MLRRRRHRPGSVETVTADSLEVGDWISEHRDGLQFGEGTTVTSSRTWVIIEELDRMANGDVRIGFKNPKAEQRRVLTGNRCDFADCLPETLVKRRVEQQR